MSQVAVQHGGCAGTVPGVLHRGSRMGAMGYGEPEHVAHPEAHESEGITCHAEPRKWPFGLSAVGEELAYGTGSRTLGGRGCGRCVSLGVERRRAAGDK